MDCGFTYLFEARLVGGEVIRQTQQDVSTIRHDKSAWYDVLQRIDEVESLLLLRDDGSPIASVRMLDGLFELNGNQFYTLQRSIDGKHLPPDGQFRPHYFRLRNKGRVIGSEIKEFDHIVGYCIGWKYIVGGDKIATQMIVIH